MTIPTGSLVTYAVTGIREDLADFISNISPTETPFMNAVGTTEASNRYHEWQTASLAAAATTNYQLEGDAITSFDSNIITSRVGNRLQISRQTAAVSGSSDAVNAAGRKKEMALQVLYKGRQLKRDMESSLLSNVASVTGNSTTPARLGGIETWLTTNDSRAGDGAQGGFSGGNTTAATDGAARAFTEALLKAVLLSCYNSGGTPDLLMVGGFNKQVVSTFTGNATKTKDVNDKRLVAAVEVYESDFGTLKVVANRFMRASSALCIDTDKIKIAYLTGRRFLTKDLPENGDYAAKMLLSEYTLQVDNEAAHGIVADLTTS